jgi:hypothetical protein
MATKQSSARRRRANKKTRGLLQMLRFVLRASRALDCFAALAMTAAHAAPSLIGGWNASPVSQGKKIHVSCDTSVMKVSTSGLPIGFA